MALSDHPELLNQLDSVRFSFFPSALYTTLIDEKNDTGFEDTSSMLSLGDSPESSMCRSLFGRVQSIEWRRNGGKGEEEVFGEWRWSGKYCFNLGRYVHFSKSHLVSKREGIDGIR